ncbi:MAG TPA: ATPase domain-containing protein [Pirellulales bacterium]|jgi:KaiC/GvpD/RAD55 family RecA-like ATPase|nr:ATPase domain-containing protein [Pirellulales bacterium]
MSRLSTGIPGLDELLGGGLLPGRLTVVVGATGIGKTQLGLQFAEAGQHQEQHRGIILDMTARGDSQSQAEYAQRMFAWKLHPASAAASPALDDFFNPLRCHGDYLHIFDRRGKRVSRSDLDFDAWHEWRAELNARLNAAIAFFYGNFIQGVRRTVIDGVEPAGRHSESIQFELFDYVYHQILRKQADWVARDLFRQRFREYAEAVAQACYDHEQIGCLLLYTSAETMLDELIRRPLDEGDVLANANTIIQLGKVMDGGKIRRALHIAKHRGSAASDQTVPFEITDHGLRLA